METVKFIGAMAVIMAAGYAAGFLIAEMLALAVGVKP